MRLLLPVRLQLRRSLRRAALMATLPVGDREPNRQAGYAAAERRRARPVGWRIAGRITKKILRAERDGRDIGQTHSR